MSFVPGIGGTYGGVLSFQMFFSMLDTVAVRASDRMDEIASHRQYYGDGAEGETYKVVEFNIAKLFENDFDLGKIKILNIPVQ